MTEEWRPVLGWEGYYEVSSQGRVRSIDRIIVAKGTGRRTLWKGRVLVTAQPRKYLTVGLTRQSAGHTYCVHRLVCESFQGPKPSPAAVVRHLNGIPTDNRAENIVWGTPKENSADMKRHGTNHRLNQTHCKHGHEFTPENTRVSRNPCGGNKRDCLTCKRERRVGELERRVRRRRELWPTLLCVVCTGQFTSSNRRAQICSAECKKASRRVEFKQGRQYQTGKTA